MNINKLRVSIFLKKDILLVDIYDQLSKFINSSMLKSDYLKNLHKNSQKFKLYSYSGLYPLAENNIYKKGTSYFFEINSSSLDILNEFKKVLNLYSNDIFVSCMVEFIPKKLNCIKKIISITPCVLTFNNKSLIEKRLCLVKNRIIANAINKYNLINNSSLKNHDFIQCIECTNNKPIKVNYKEGFFFGFKVNLTIKDDDLSQRIAETIVNTGLLEKNSLGFGFCKGYEG